MHFRLVRPMMRKGSSNYQFVQRIPVDLKDRLPGMKLSIPMGDELVSLTVSPKADAIRLSLRTSSPAEIKDRHAGVASYLTRLFDALRNDTPMVLSHRNAVALAGEFYRSWSSELERSNTIAFEHTGGGWEKVHSGSPSELAAGFGAAALRLQQLEGAGADEELEATIGPLVDRLLLEKGISSLEEHWRSACGRL